MVKERTNVTIEEDIMEKAREKGINVSNVSEKALIAELEIDSVNIDRSIKSCEFCNSPSMRKATADNLKGLTWLWPDERWICPKCLKAKSRSILK